MVVKLQDESFSVVVLVLTMVPVRKAVLLNCREMFQCIPRNVAPEARSERSRILPEICRRGDSLKMRKTTTSTSHLRPSPLDNRHAAASSPSTLLLGHREHH